MKWAAFNWMKADVGFSVDDDTGHPVGVLGPDEDGVWSLSVVGEAFHPADYVSAHDLRNIAMAIDHLNSGDLS